MAVVSSNPKVRTRQIYIEGASVQVYQAPRTLLLKDTSLRSNCVDVVPIHPGGTLRFVLGVLRVPITLDLVVNLNIVTASASTLVGTFTIPLATTINTGVMFTVFSVTTMPDLSILSWDIVSSDNQIVPSGVASFSVYYQ
jgi:hypothetical protein